MGSPDAGHWRHLETCYKWALSGPSLSPESGSVLGEALLGFRRPLESENPGVGHWAQRPGRGSEGASPGPGLSPPWGVNAPPPCSRASLFAGHGDAARQLSGSAASLCVLRAMTQSRPRPLPRPRDATKPRGPWQRPWLRVTWLPKTGPWWLRQRSPPGPQSREHGPRGMDTRVSTAGL